MNALEAILSRRSIRKYTSQPVPDATVKKLLSAAMSAPSAGNEQPWHFIVITDRQTLDSMPMLPPGMRLPEPGPIQLAPLAILVCGDPTSDRFHMGFWILDCAAATENILIAAHAEGLGAVWLPAYPDEERVKGIRSLLGIPEHIVPFALIPLGYPAESKPPNNRFDTARIRSNRW